MVDGSHQIGTNYTHLDLSWAISAVIIAHFVDNFDFFKSAELALPVPSL